MGQPSLALLVWALVGVYALIGSLQVIELGTMIPKAGAWYVFARRAFGDYVGFLIGISSWLGSIAAMAFGAAVMGEYIALLVPPLTLQRLVSAQLLTEHISREPVLALTHQEPA